VLIWLRANLNGFLAGPPPQAGFQSPGGNQFPASRCPAQTKPAAPPRSDHPPRPLPRPWPRTGLGRAWHRIVTLRGAFGSRSPAGSGKPLTAGLHISPMAQLMPPNQHGCRRAGPRKNPPCKIFRWSGPSQGPRWAVAVAGTDSPPCQRRAAALLVGKGSSGQEESGLPRGCLRPTKVGGCFFFIPPWRVFGRNADAGAEERADLVGLGLCLRIDQTIEDVDDVPARCAASAVAPTTWPAVACIRESASSRLIQQQHQGCKRPA